MDVSKESKKRTNQLLGGKKEGLLRLLLTEQAYKDESSRAALCGVLRLLTGGYPLPTSITAKPLDAEWWRDNNEPEKVTEDSLMNHRMRTFGEGLASPGAATDEETVERLRFIVEKLFARKASGRSVRLPRLLECGDVLVYIVGQVPVPAILHPCAILHARHPTATPSYTPGHPTPSYTPPRCQPCHPTPRPPSSCSRASTPPDPSHSRAVGVSSHPRSPCTT